MSAAADADGARSIPSERPSWTKEYVAALKRGLSSFEARKALNVTVREVRRLEESDSRFALECQDVCENVNEELEAFALDLAFGRGTEKDGSPRRKYDPGMLRFLLKARKPEIYGTRTRAEIKAVRNEMIVDTDPPIVERGRVS